MISVNAASDPNQVTTGDAAPGVVTIQANMVVTKWPEPLVCQVALSGAMTCVALEQDAVPENVRTAFTEAVFEEDLEVMTTKSPIEAGAAKVQEAATAKELCVHDAAVYVIVCAPADEAANSRKVVIIVFIRHNPVES